MNRTKHAVIISLFASMRNGRSHYTKASANRIRELLAKYHDIQVQRRWLFYCLADAEEMGIIRRKVRFYRHTDGTVYQLSSMVSFTLYGLKYLTKKKVTGAANLLKQMLAWLASKDKRWPDAETINQNFSPGEIMANKLKVKTLVESLA